MIDQTVPLIGSTSSQKMKILLKWLLLLSIVLIPIWHIGEAMAIFNAEFRDQAALHTPMFLIVIKNLLVPAMVIISFLIRCSRGNRLSPVELIISFVLVVILLLAVLMTPDMDVWKFIAGFRWFLPFFLMILMIPVVDKNLIRQLAYASVAIMVVNLTMQLWQLGYMNHSWWGVLPGTNLAARTPGFFPLPNPSAMFACFSVLFAFLMFKDMRTRWTLGVLGMVSVLLTQSGTGFCVMLIILATLAAGSYWRVCLPVIVPASFYLTKFVMPYFRGSHYFNKSLGVREKIFTDATGMSGTGMSDWFSRTLDWLFGAHFGLGTNVAALLHHNFGVDIIPVGTDSFLTQLMVNLGGFSLLFYLALMTVVALAAYRSGARVTVLWLFAIGIFSVTVSITEAFPMFLLIIVAMTYSMKRGDFCLRKKGC